VENLLLVFQAFHGPAFPHHAQQRLTAALTVSVAETRADVGWGTLRQCTLDDGQSGGRRDRSIRPDFTGPLRMAAIASFESPLPKMNRLLYAEPLGTGNSGIKHHFDFLILEGSHPFCCVDT